MTKRFLIAASLLLSAVCAFGQGACYPAGVVLLDTGRPANGASVRVCTAGSTGTPCTPAASLFTDPTLGTPLVGSPTVITDSHGNFGFCAAAGTNYDLQISGSGITTLNIKNLPLPPTTPITAASVTSSSANPANVGVIKLASGDGIDWRNNANSGNVQVVKTGAAAGNVPADTLDLTAFGGVRAGAVIDNSANPAAAGVARCGNNVPCLNARNAGNSADLALLQADTANNAQIGPPLRQVEQAAPSGIASSDLLWADSTAHKWKANNNNGGAATLAYTDVAQSWSGTQTGMALGGTVSYGRLRANLGSALVAGDLSISAAWGSTATKAVVGTDGRFRLSITSAGTGQAVNPTFTITFHDGAWNNAPICMPLYVSNIAPIVSPITETSAPTTTTGTWLYPSTPVSGSTYVFNVDCQDR